MSRSFTIPLIIRDQLLVPWDVDIWMNIPQGDSGAALNADIWYRRVYEMRIARNASASGKLCNTGYIDRYIWSTVFGAQFRFVEPDTD